MKRRTPMERSASLAGRDGESRLLAALSSAVPLNTVRLCRRVVVACDRCRHKKIRCKGLPNARNICNNCDGMGYGACGAAVRH